MLNKLSHLLGDLDGLMLRYLRNDRDAYKKGASLSVTLNFDIIANWKRPQFQILIVFCFF